ncbi:MAG: hypothetical protein KC620_24135, partial [Myxococcales bacterium]|nr:hypothetical protein [Myxococcales bacterium]
MPKLVHCSSILAVAFAGTALAQPESDPAPPLPPAGAFKEDQAAFDDVLTEPERLAAEREARERKQVSGGDALYQRHPILAFEAESVAGLFAAGAVGLLGGTIGDAIAAGDDTQPLGGFRGPAIGALVGSTAGAAIGVWGGAYMMEKPVSPLWT